MNHAIDYAEFALAAGSVIVSLVGFMIRAAIKSGNSDIVSALTKIDGKIDIHVAEDRIIHGDVNRRLAELEHRRA